MMSASCFRLVLLTVAILCTSQALNITIIDEATPADPEEENAFQYETLPRCNMTTKELVGVDDSAIIDPCILYDVSPEVHDFRSSIITIVGVFPSGCDEHRDGALAAVEQLNGDNNGKGAKIGYNGNHYLQFRYVVVISGNSQQLPPDVYARNHEGLLEATVMSLQPQYIMGSCSYVAKHDKRIAGKYQTILLSQVGPDIFYTQDSNDYVFGVHIRSETYGIPAFQAVKFSTKDKSKQKIRILHRDRSQFFNSTCQEIYKHALQDGFTDTVAISYNPQGDEDNDGVDNQHDVPYLQSLADQACPPNQTSRSDDPPVAIWACVMTDLETNTILDRWRSNGCQPSSLWLHAAAKAYATRYPENVAYMQAGAQWHKAMAYSDEYFSNGQAMLDYIEDSHGYKPDYDALGTYHAVYLAYKNTASFVKTKDNPNVHDVYANQYEEVRRHLLGLSVPKSLFGPTSFDENRRNIGRGSAGMQWGFRLDSSANESKLEKLLVSPIDQAEATVVVPAPTALDCPAGQFVNMSATDSALLEDKCSACPVDTYRSLDMPSHFCQPCKDGSGTDGDTGAKICHQVEDNLIPRGLLIFGYFIMALSFSCSLGFGVWTIVHRNDAVVQISQMEFLLLLCLGSIISTSSIIPLSIQARTEDDTMAASVACVAIPWLYSTGWIIQYSSMFAKSYRMFQMVQNSNNMRRTAVTALDVAHIVLVCLVINWALVTAWTIVDPLTWTREDQGTNVDEEAGILTEESVGKCSSDYMTAWLGSLLGFHLTIMIATNVLLWQLRTVSDRYQESKFITLASLFACEFLLLGIPILIAVGDSSEARHIALVCIIGFTDLGVLLMVFLPKIGYQRQGLPEGISAASSLFKASARPSARPSTLNFQASFANSSFAHSSFANSSFANSSCAFSGIREMQKELEQLCEEEEQELKGAVPRTPKERNMPASRTETTACKSSEFYVMDDSSASSENDESPTLQA
ncbi:Gamma-aminobutyric acid (GABA) B receptor [Seminavis robusta]|uniref:Gamma-aminobutyric acid (GABA) B receptor n=1 Tax=Seminavis robusta TaxID=568900 RepID=A0A9N8HLX1_9STRA|nr:Gamma-aminobutyric acid (GABA) B receptor [Seminavis robusta]|eukprot:Sro708_g190670.1 Gamma-aminobutyric acid (GABA) B receptor (973) ;mRNA; f:6380-9298